MRRPVALALAFAALVLAVPSVALGKAPSEVYVFMVDGTQGTVTPGPEATTRFGEVFWAPWNWPSERMPEGAVLAYRYVLLLAVPDPHYRYVYFYMPGGDGKPGYYFQASSPTAGVYYPAGIDDLVLTFAPPASGDARYVVGDPQPNGWVPLKSAVPPGIPWWPVLPGAALVVGAAWAVRRSRRGRVPEGPASDAK